MTYCTQLPDSVCTYMVFNGVTVVRLSVCLSVSHFSPGCLGGINPKVSTYIGFDQAISEGI